MSNKKKDKKILRISFDIECTGQNLSKDKVYAIGVCDSEYNGFSIGLNLAKPKNTDWKDYWQQQGWENRCWEEFTCKNLHLLEKLQDKNSIDLFDNEKLFIDTLQEKVLAMEKNPKYDKIEYVTDAIGFDFAWLTMLFTKYGYPSMTYNRSGKYIRRFEVDTYIMGMSNNVSENYDNVKDFKTELHDKYGKSMRKLVYHDPKDDAEHIMRSYMFANIHVKQESTNKKRKLK